MVCVSSDDGTFYFDEKNIGAFEYKGPITTSASVVRGVTSFANVVSGKLNVSFFISVSHLFIEFMLSTFHNQQLSTYRSLVRKY